MGKRLLLHFGAVDYEASVWVNGQLAVLGMKGDTPLFMPRLQTFCKREPMY
ncbi:hypothetical protein [Paenibacillus sp. Z3-2]